MTPTTKTIKPVEWYEDTTLGVMFYDKDDNTWLGHFNGYNFRIACINGSTPHRDLLRYCIETLSKKQWLDSTLVKKKDKRKACCNPVLHLEIDGLLFHHFMFDYDENKLQLLVQLATAQQVKNDEERLWFINVTEDNWSEIDFYL